MAKNNKEFQNLRTIYSIQSSGEIQNLLKQLKAGKYTVDNLIKSVYDVKKQNRQIATEKAASVLASNNEIKTEKTTASQDVKTAAPITEKNHSDSEKPFKKEEGFQNKRQFDRNQKPDFQRQNQQGNTGEQRFQRPYDQNRQGNYDPNRQQRPYDPNRQQGQLNQGGQRTFDPNRQQRPYDPNRQQRPYDPNRQQGQFNQGGQRTFDPNRQQRPYDPNRQQRPYDPNRQQGQFNQGGQRTFDPNRQQRPFGQRPAGQQGVAFASSKSNSVRVFQPELESSRVLAQPERNYGNKSKTKRTYVEERDKGQRKGTGSFRKSNTVLTDNFEEIQMGSRKLIKNKRKEPVYIAPAIEHAIINGETCTVKVLSEKIGKPAAEIIKKLMLLGVMATINSAIDFTTAELVASELGITLEQKLELTAEQELTQTVDLKLSDEDDSTPRPPVVAVMGHVDHGKTSLLDIIRKSSVATSEAGGITQGIGAYQVTTKDQKITFLDTPGHAAFTSMRARGAKITDVAILVVAADDGIMPQTLEAINHIKAAEVPMIVALNKMDKKEANPERIKTQLSEQGLLPEEWGGDTIIVPVSAKAGQGIDELLNMILLVSQMQELKANPNRLAVGTVIEASLDKAKGPMATVLVQNGTLKVGDTIICGITYGKVKAMFDENGKNLTSALPSTPVSVLGFNEVPLSGDQVYVVDEKLSKQVIQERKNKIKTDKTTQSSAVSLDSFMDKVNEGKLKNLNIIVKADSQGSVEALKQSLAAVSNEEVKIICVHSGVGQVTESDLVLAQASSSIIINFNLKVDGKIKVMADSMLVDIRDYKVIYEVVEEISSNALNMREKVYEKVIIGHAEVRVVFKLSTSGVIAGSYITDGKVARNAGARLLRDGEEIADTTIEALKIQKDDKAEVNYGYECGIKLKNVNTIKEGDIIEVYKNVEVKR